MTIQAPSELSARQEQLFPFIDVVREERLRMRSFIAEELTGADISGDDEVMLIHSVDVMAIAAESLAQTIARSRGDVDEDSKTFLAESILEKINSKDATGAFLFDLDHELECIDRVDDAVVDILSQRAFELAKAAVDVVRAEAIK